MFLGLNRSKRSLALNLRTEQGREIAKTLAAQMDVFVEGYRPGAIEKFGLGADALMRENPRLVYLSVSAYGQGGPLRERRGIDPIIQTTAGIPAEQGGSGAPELVQGSFVDYMTGALAYGAVMMALYVRERTGEGQRIDASLLGGATAMQFGRLMWASSEVEDALNDRIARVYEVSDGHIYLYMDVDGFWEKSSEVLGLPELLEEEAWRTFRGRHEAREEIIPLVQEVLRTAPGEEWVRKFEGEGVPCARVRKPTDLYEDPQMKAMGYLAQAEHPEYGVLRLGGIPVKFDKTPSSVRRPPPVLGQHSDEVLAELGLSAEEIVR
ncbi:MAG: CoA transferase [Nitrospinae bacterium]|nr:CoA transferase [Nitrospinota bacterium]